MIAFIIFNLFFVVIGLSETDPPPAPVNSFAEFDISSGSLISYNSYLTYGFGQPMSLIQDLAEDGILYILLPPNSQSNCENILENNGIDLNNVEFLPFNHDTYWTKNFGPYFVLDGNNEIGIVDFHYDRPDRPNDNAIPFHLAEHWGYNYFDSDIVHNGGNLMFDGFVTASSSLLPYSENFGADVDQLMLDYYGTDSYLTVDDPWGNYHEHIDCWAKFLSSEKIIICQVPSTHPEYDEMESVAEFYENQLNSFNEQYQIFRVYTPNGEPYANSYILNDNVYVPTGFGQWDDEALEVFREALPEYTVRGYSDYSYIATDALNCRVMNIPDFEAVRIIHNPLNDFPAPMDEYIVNASFIDLSGNGISNESLNLYWKNQFMDDYEVLLLNQIEYSEEFSAIIPEQPGDTPVHYYLEGGNTLGRIDRLPIAGYFEFYAFGGPGFANGDINMDMVININDILLMVNHILNIYPISGYGLILADLNEDGTINVFDIIQLVNIIMG